MNKKTKAIYVLGSVLIGALAVLCVYFILMATGVITVQKPKVVVSSSGASKEYDGTELTNDSWSLVTGELKKGHTIEVTTTGVQTDIGSSSNLFSVKIKNAKGKDVTDDYVVESKPGDLVVTKRKIEVTIEDESKIYDGEVLLPQSYNLTKGTLLKGHTLDVTLNGERVEVGLGYANAVCVVTDALGEEHTDNYEIIVVKGELLVNPIPITIKTGSAVKYYDGEPLTCDTYEVVSIYQLLDGHQIQISIVGSITEMGTADNVVGQTIIVDAYGNDVTDYYNIDYILGQLIVQGIPPIGGGAGGGAGGAGGGAGGGSLGLDNSGVVGLPSGGGGTPMVVPVLRIYSERSDVVYLRYFNYTDFDGRNWTNFTDCYSELIDGVYSANYLTSIALENLGFSGVEVEIEMLTANYVLPYYMALGEYDYQIQTSDVEYTGDYSVPYSLVYLPFTYVNQSTVLENANLGDYADFELAYREYVYDTYLNVPNSSATYLQSVIAEKSFDKSDVDIIAKVAHYIQNAAVYNKEYNRELDNEDDILVAFLDEYKEGICQHYAISATMLYRQLGIPARYSFGYMATTKANDWVTVMSNQAHAWVEVYIDGVGWVNVEVTGSSNEDIPLLGEITVKAKAKYVNVAEQSVIYASELEYEIENFEEFAIQGYVCEVTLEGRQVGVGRSYPTLGSITIIDPDGYDVTSLFKVNFFKGYMAVYEKKVTIRSGSATKIYDGTPLTCDEYSIIDGELIAGHSIVITPIGEITKVGEVRNFVSTRIVDAYGEDVSDMYYVITVSGKLTVTAQPITIVAGSDSKVHDGTPLTCNTYTLYDMYGNQIDSLGEGIQIQVEIEGSIVEFGRCDNVIKSVTILDAEGNDITELYMIDKQNGQLRITK